MVKKKNLTLLIVEDDEVMRKLLVHKAEASGYEALEAADGKEAIAHFGKNKFDAVILDLLLPKVDGFAVLENLRQHKQDELSRTPVVVLSNLWSNKDILRAKALTIDAYFVKANTELDEVLHKLDLVLYANY